MSSITYLLGDATDPQGPKGPKIVAHCCNNIGVWGAGFVLAVSKRWPEPEAEYRAWCREEYQIGPPLGAVQFVEVDSGVIVANIIGQSGTTWRQGVPPVRYLRHNNQVTHGRAQP